MWTCKCVCNSGLLCPLNLPLNETSTDKFRQYLTDYNNRPFDSISFMPMMILLVHLDLHIKTHQPFFLVLIDLTQVVDVRSFGLMRFLLFFLFSFFFAKLKVIRWKNLKTLQSGDGSMTLTLTTYQGHTVIVDVFTLMTWFVVVLEQVFELIVFVE